MADNENYIGLAMGIDVTDLKAGLSEANKQIQLANSEFKAASSGMDDWTKSTEGITAKVKQLDTVLKLQKSKLAGLNAEYEKTVKSQGANSEAARKLKVQINNQQAVVNSTERELKNYSETLKEAENGNLDLESATLKSGKSIQKQGEAAAENSKKFEGLKGVAGGLVKGLAAVAGAAVGAVTGFLSLAESTRETRTMMAKLETQFATAGLSAEDAKDTYSELYGVLGDTGKASEAAAFLGQMASSEEELADYTNILTGVYAKYGDSLPVEGLAEAMNHTAQLGSVQGNLADALEWSGASVDDFNAQLATCNTVEERQALITSTLNGLYSEQAADYKERNKDVIEAQEAQEKLNLALAELGKIAEPIMTTLKLIAVDLIETITPFVQLIGEGLTGALSGAEGATEKLADGISGILSTLVEKLVSMLPSLGSIAVRLIETFATTILQNLPSILSAAIQLILTLVRGIAQMAPTLIPAIVDAVILICETILDNLDLVIDAAIELIMALADGLLRALPKLIEKIPVIIDKLVKAISSNLPKLISAGIELTKSLASGIIKAIPQLVSKIPQIISSIVSGLKEGLGKIKEIGLNLVKGIWEGIKSGAGWLKDKISGFADNVAGWFKKTFKISSPSKLMASEVGEYIGEGVGVGILDSIPNVKKQLGKFSSFVQDNLGGIKSGLSFDGISGSTAGTIGNRSTVVNAGMTVNYNGNLSRKQLKQLENDNYTAIKTRLRMEGAI